MANDDFGDLVQKQRDNIHQFEVTHLTLNTSRNEVKRAKELQLSLEDGWGLPVGKNQDERDKWIRRKQGDDFGWKAAEAEVTSAASIIAENEGRREALKYSIRLTERELDYAIVMAKGVTD